MTRAGRPAGPASETEFVVLTAALTLLLQEGGAALTAQRLHQVTGVSRSTIYRHWPTPIDVLASLIEVAPSAERRLSGDALHDTHAEVDALCDRLRDKPVAAFLRALVGMASASASGGSVELLRQRYVTGLSAPFRRALSDVDLPRQRINDAIAAIASPLLVDALLVDQTAARGRAHRAVDLYLCAPETGEGQETRK